MCVYTWCMCVHSDAYKLIIKKRKKKISALAWAKRGAAALTLKKCYQGCRLKPKGLLAWAQKKGCWLEPKGLLAWAKRAAGLSQKKGCWLEPKGLLAWAKRRAAGLAPKKGCWLGPRGLLAWPKRRAAGLGQKDCWLEPKEGLLAWAQRRAAGLSPKQGYWLGPKEGLHFILLYISPFLCPFEQVSLPCPQTHYTLIIRN